MVPSLLLSFKGLLSADLRCCGMVDAATADIIIGIGGAKPVFNRCDSPVEHRAAPALTEAFRKRP